MHSLISGEGANSSPAAGLCLREGSPPRNGGGVLVNMLSVVSRYVYPTYCATKHAALAVTGRPPHPTP